MMLRKYFVVNTWTGYQAFHGRRFFTVKGAVRKIIKSPFGSMMELRKFI